MLIDHEDERENVKLAKANLLKQKCGSKVKLYQTKIEDYLNLEDDGEDLPKKLHPTKKIRKVRNVKNSRLKFWEFHITE